MAVVVIQLHESVPVKTPLGDGYAIIFEGSAHDNYWTVALSTGAIVTFRQEQIRAARSYTHGRQMTDQEMTNIIQEK